MKFADRLRAAWSANPVPKSKLASACKVSKGAVTQWFSGDTQPKSEAAMLLAQELGVSLDWLVLGKNPSRLRSDSDGEERVLRENDAPAYAAGKPRPASLRHLPLLAWNALEEKTEEASVYYPCPLPCSQHSFALKIQGDSMFPAYRDGEIIYVDPEAAPEHNRDVVLRNAQGSVTFRRLQQAPDGPYLLAINPDQPERFIKMPDDGRILGVIIASYMER